MENHALTYSKGYAAKKGYTFWEKDFDAMAQKTMLRQILSKWGILSVELQKALINDEQVIDVNGQPIEIEEEQKQLTDGKTEQKKAVEIKKEESTTEQPTEAIDPLA